MGGPIEIIGTATAALLLRVFGFGRARVDLSVGPKRLPWHDFRREPDGTWLIGESLASLIGILVWVVAVAAIVQIMR